MAIIVVAIYSLDAAEDDQFLMVLEVFRVSVRTKARMIVYCYDQLERKPAIMIMTINVVNHVSPHWRDSEPGESRAVM